MALEVLKTTCCVVGGGPAGIMLGYLLARKGVEVTVLEKHQDFFRDFRGDTVHPSTLEVLKELGLLEEFLDLPHEKVESLGVIVGDSLFDVVDFRHVPVTCKFVALMPQWDFLNFLSAKAKRFPSFQLLTQHEATDLVRDGERITGVVVRNRGLGFLREITNIKWLFARLRATYRRQRASSLLGNVVASQGITITLSHSSPFAL